MALAEHARTVSGGQNELETVRDLLQTVFDSDSSHVNDEVMMDGKRRFDLADRRDPQRTEHVLMGADLLCVLEAVSVNDCLQVKEGAFK